MERTLAELMHRSSQIELQVAAIYDMLACSFYSDLRLSHFWMLFAEAERYHSLLINMQKVMVKHLQLDRERLSIWRAELDQATAYLDGISARLKNGWHPTVSEAFLLAHEIEGRSLEIQARSLEFAGRSQEGELFAQLHEEDMGHRNKLLQARTQFDPTFAGEG